MIPIERKPDFVIPVRLISTYIDLQNEVCGLCFDDSSERRYLLPIPGKVLAGLATDMQKAVASVHGLVEWQSKMPNRKA